MAKAWRVFLKPNGNEPGGYVDCNVDITLDAFMMLAKLQGGVMGTAAFIPLDQIRLMMQVEIEQPQGQILPFSGPKPVA